MARAERFDEAKGERTLPVGLLLIVLQPRQPVSERRGDIVRPGQGTVASGIGDGELKICV